MARPAPRAFLVVLLAAQSCAANFIKPNAPVATPDRILEKLTGIQHTHASRVWQTLDGTRALVTDLKNLKGDTWLPPPPTRYQVIVCGSSIWWREPTMAHGDKECPNDCNGVGVCNHDIGVCQCPAGWKGDDCATPKKRPCTNRWSRSDETPGEPRSHINDRKEDLNLREPGWTASRCSGVCDDVYGGCFCGYNSVHARVPAPEGSPPGTPPIRVGRPMHDGCKAKTDATGAALDWGGVAWPQLYGPEGWCNSTTGNVAMHCGCPYEDMTGPFCELRKLAYCPNQCNLRGTCIIGFCKCDQGWYGTSCDKRKAGVAPTPPPAHRMFPDMDNVVREPFQGSQRARLPGAHRKRPLIYIYDLPAEYNAQMLQYRLTPGHGTWRGFSDANTTHCNQGVYLLETYFHETLITSSHRTLDPEEADFFFMPMYISCYMWPVLGWADGPWWYAPMASPRPMHATNMVLEAKRWVQKHYPYWDRHGGRDHILLYTHDEGACYMPSEVYDTAIMLTHWGRTDHNHRSGSAYVPDNYTAPMNDFPKHQPGDWRELYKGHPCYTPGKDLVVPAVKLLEQYGHTPLLGNVPYKRDVLLFLRGDVGLYREWWYSRGIRQSLYRLAHEDGWREKYGIVIGVTGQYGGDYATWLARSKYCLVVPGDGWSARAEDAVLNGCVPVLINDHVEPIFHGLLDWDTFSVRVPQRMLHDLPRILMDIPGAQLEAMQRQLALVWTRFAYLSGPLFHSQLPRLYASRAELRNKTRLAPKHPYHPLAHFPIRQDAFHTIMQWLASRIPHIRGPDGSRLGGLDDSAQGEQQQQEQPLGQATGQVQNLEPDADGPTADPPRVTGADGGGAVPSTTAFAAEAGEAQTVQALPDPAPKEPDAAAAAPAQAAAASEQQPGQAQPAAEAQGAARPTPGPTAGGTGSGVGSLDSGDVGGLTAADVQQPLQQPQPSGGANASAATST